MRAQNIGAKTEEETLVQRSSREPHVDGAFNVGQNACSEQSATASTTSFLYDYFDNDYSFSFISAIASNF